MKKILTFFLAGATTVALSAVSVACNTTQTELETEIKPISVKDDVADLLDENIYLIGSSIFEERIEHDLFNSPRIDSCVMINNTSELAGIDIEGASINMPAIDFDSHTLIIGVFLDHGGDYILSKQLFTEQGEAVMNITLGRENDDTLHPAMAIPKYFWGLYPKIYEKSIHTNVTHKN